jgi:hypothetical protein
VAIEGGELAGTADARGGDGVLVKRYDRTLRFILVGCGKTGVELAKMALDQGFECVAAVTNRTGLGEDLGRFLGIGKDLGVRITNDLDAVLENLNRAGEAGAVDLAFEQTAVYPLGRGLKPILLKLLRAKLNVASIREDLFFSWGQDPEVSEELDRVATASGVTLVGGGFQDMYWSQTMLTLLGGSHRVRKCGIRDLGNLDLYGGDYVRKIWGLGLDLAAWEKREAKNPARSAPPLHIPQFIAAAMGWDWKGAKVAFKKTALTPERPVPSKALGLDIQTGMVHGVQMEVMLTCENGVEILFAYTAQILRDDEKEQTEVFVEGSPNTRLVFTENDSLGGTAAGMLGRAMDIVEARPGFIPCFELGPIRSLF